MTKKATASVQRQEDQHGAPTAPSLKVGAHDVRFVDAARFKAQVAATKYGDVLAYLVAHPDTLAEIGCDSHEEARELQTGFQSSSAARKLRLGGQHFISGITKDHALQLRLRGPDDPIRPPRDRSTDGRPKRILRKPGSKRILRKMRDADAVDAEAGVAVPEDPETLRAKIIELQAKLAKKRR